MNRSPYTNPFRHFRLGLSPETALIEVSDADGPIGQAFNHVLTDVRRKKDT
jgi:hypothetical protein